MAETEDDKKILKELIKRLPEELLMGDVHNYEFAKVSILSSDDIDYGQWGFTKEEVKNSKITIQINR